MMNPRIPSRLFSAVVFGLFLVLLSCSTAFADSDQPRVGLEPEDVVRIQLEALKTNGPANEGIARTFRFASPANRAVTGPLERFALLFRSPAYQPMLNHVTSVVYSPVMDSGLALVPVTLTQSDGSEVDYMFVLSRQTMEPYEDMWMTDAVQYQGAVIPADPDPERTI